MKRSLEILDCIIRQMQGVLLPRISGQNKMFADVQCSIMDLEFCSNKSDKKNMAGDIQLLGRDFKKSTELAKQEFKAIL